MEILAAKKAIEGGRNEAVLFAVVQCVEAGLVAPEWLAAAFLQRYDTVMHAKARSWDEVFGDPWRGTAMSDKRRELEMAAPIVQAVENLVAAGRSRTYPLFAEVAERLGLTGATTSGASYCRKVYYKWRDRPEFRVIRAAAVVAREDRKHSQPLKTSTRKKKVV